MTLFKDSIDKIIPNGLKITFAAVAMIMATQGCTSMKVVNRDVSQKMVAQLGHLKTGASKQDVLRILRIKNPRKCMHISKEIKSIRDAFYGGEIQIVATPEQLEGFRKKLKGHEVWVLPIEKVKSKWGAGWGTWKTKKRGYRDRLVFIFKDGKLVSDVEGSNTMVSEQDSKAIVPGIVERGIGTAAGVVVGGGLF